MAGHGQDWETHGDDVNNGYLDAWAAAQEKGAGGETSKPAIVIAAAPPSSGTGIWQDGEVHGPEDLAPGGAIYEWYQQERKPGVS